MKTNFILDEDMRWRKGDRVNFTIENTLYLAEIKDVFIDSSENRYEYELELTQQGWDLP